jgi:hypothetical protein
MRCRLADRPVGRDDRPVGHVIACGVMKMLGTSTGPVAYDERGDGVRGS